MSRDLQRLLQNMLVACGASFHSEGWPGLLLCLAAFHSTVEGREEKDVVTLLRWAAKRVEGTVAEAIAAYMADQYEMRAAQIR